MAWDSDLLEDQKIASAHVGTHARLLAGPGTGKTLTLTRRICFLVTERDISAESILALTFTRAAARELRQRVSKELGKDRSPRISTLHSFALRQLLKNATKITDLPQPLRIADDWEEHNVVLPDLKSLLGLQRTDHAKDLLNELSADWESLTAEDKDWENRFPNPAFLSAWRQHRQIYGYTLRSELVYQLKKALEQRGDFKFESPIKYLLVDEYQDLNRCDLAVVKQIALQGAELFIAGDDDQSIYGFRKAHPEGIRSFPNHYPNTTKLGLEICKRCDRDILELGLYVARQDHQRIEKKIQSESGKGKGEVALLRFDNQDAEAKGIADLCTHLVAQHELKPNDILILLRSDHKGHFSRPIRKKLEGAGISVVAVSDTTNPLDEEDGRSFLAFLRLAVRSEDSLAWRTLLQVWCKGVGEGAIRSVYDLAHSRGKTFAQTVIAAHDNNNILSTRHRSRLAKAIKDVLCRQEDVFPEDSRGKYETHDELMDMVRTVAKSVIGEGKRDSILLKIERTVGTFRLTSIEELVRAIDVDVENENIEQELEEGKVNILTMHRAKGLTAKAVIVAAAEDQYIPGRSQGEAEDDERRLLYVSLTRAEHHLFITHCDKRTGPQRHTGRDSGSAFRSLTRFLRDCPHFARSRDGIEFIDNL